MFEAAELHRKISKAEFEAAIPELRERLLKAQRALQGTRRSVIIVISGVENSGKSELVNRLTEWLDARGMKTHAFWQESDEEQERPQFWRFWRSLPPRGTIGVMFGSWYTRPIVDRVFKRLRAADLDRELHRIVFFERMLADDGAVIIKLWLHIPLAEQESRFQQRKKKGWAFSPWTKEYMKRTDRFSAVSERAIRLTDTAEAPWHVIEATDARYRDLTVGRILAEALEDAVQPQEASRIAMVHADEEGELADPEHTVLDALDLSRKIDDDDYDKSLSRLQSKIAALAWKGWNEKRSSVIIFEGWDASGKGGAIRRLIGPVDARLYNVISVAAPTDEERAQHYLWRFWRHIPRAGRLTVYDRSWYGRVLVERVEGFARVDEWSRAYREINDFEEQLVEHGIILVKFWLHIDPEEQLRRFKEREQIAYKQHKITEEDWRNREKWNPYKCAVHDMVKRTSSAIAPWHIVPGNDKKLARLDVLKKVAGAMEKGLGKAKT